MGRPQRHRRAGLYDGAQTCFEEAIALYDGLGDTHAAARVTSRLAFLDERSGRHELAIKRMEDALVVIGEDEPDEDVALLTVRLGNARVFIGEMESGAELIDRALEMGEALGLAEILVRGWSARSILVAPTRRREAEMLMRSAAELAIERGLIERAGTTLGNLSDLAFGDDRYEEALGYLDRVLELAGRSGDRANEWFAASEATYAFYQLGRWDDALAAFAQLPTELLPSGHTLISPLTSILPIHIHRGNHEQARRLCDVYAPLEDSIDVQERSCYAAGRAVLALDAGRFEEALVLADSVIVAQGVMGPWQQTVKLGLVTALEAALALGRTDRIEELLGHVERQPAGRRTPLTAAHAHRMRGRIAAEPEVAEAEFDEAERILRETGILFWLAVVRLEHAEARMRNGSGDAGTLLQEARETFVAVGATPWIARADAVAAPVHAEPAS